MRNTLARNIALGGVMAALAIVIMCLGGMIPLATFVCPMLCVLLQYVVYRICKGRIAWAWFGAVALLSVLLSPDKEAALVFCMLGCYPMVKPWLERSKLHWLWKALLFNSAVALVYGLLLRVLGLHDLLREYRTMGIAGLVICLALANATFFLMDRLLTMLAKRTFGRKRH